MLDSILLGAGLLAHSDGVSLAFLLTLRAVKPFPLTLMKRQNAPVDGPIGAVSSFVQ